MNKYMLIFLLGFFSCAFLFSIFEYSNLEIPFMTGLVSLGNDALSPSDRVGNEDIIVLKDKIILKISGATLSSYADTGSMNPVFDEGANGIRVKPKNKDDVEVGDIVSYRLFGFLVVHRVIEKGEDGKGTYFIAQGDNNAFPDGKIRFEDIEYVTVGIIY